MSNHIAELFADGLRQIDASLPSERGCWRYLAAASVLTSVVLMLAGYAVLHLIGLVK